MRNLPTGLRSAIDPRETGRVVQPCYIQFIRRTLDMNGIYSAQLNESNLTSLGCLIGRKSHQPHSCITGRSHQYIYIRLYLRLGEAVGKNCKKLSSIRVQKTANPKLNFDFNFFRTYYFNSLKYGADFLFNSYAFNLNLISSCIDST